MNVQVRSSPTPRRVAVPVAAILKRCSSVPLGACVASVTAVAAAAGDVEVELAGGAHDQGAAGGNGDGLRRRHPRRAAVSPGWIPARMSGHYHDAPGLRRHSRDYQSPSSRKVVSCAQRSKSVGYYQRTVVGGRRRTATTPRVSLSEDIPQRQRFSAALCRACGGQAPASQRGLLRPPRHRTGEVGSQELRASVVKRRAYNRQRASCVIGCCASAEKLRLASSLGGVGEPEASPLASRMGGPLDRTG